MKTKKRTVHVHASVPQYAENGKLPALLASRRNAGQNHLFKRLCRDAQGLSASAGKNQLRTGRGVFNVSLAISPDFSAGRAKASGKKATPKSCLTNGRIWSDVAASISGENVSPSAANISRAKA